MAQSRWRSHGEAAGRELLDSGTQDGHPDLRGLAPEDGGGALDGCPRHDGSTLSLGSGERTMGICRCFGCQAAKATATDNPVRRTDLGWRGVDMWLGSIQHVPRAR